MLDYVTQELPYQRTVFEPSPLPPASPPYPAVPPRPPFSHPHLATAGATAPVAARAFGAAVAPTAVGAARRSAWRSGHAAAAAVHFYAASAQYAARPAPSSSPLLSTLGTAAAVATAALGAARRAVWRPGHAAASSVDAASRAAAAGAAAAVATPAIAASTVAASCRRLRRRPAARRRLPRRRRPRLRPTRLRSF